MKIKNLFSVIGLGLFALASVGVAMFNKSEAVPARAKVSPSETYNIVGTWTGWGNDPVMMDYDTEQPQNAAMKFNYIINANAEFLIRPELDWDEKLDISKLAGGGARGYFIEGSEGNIKCTLTASYNIFVVEATQLIYIEFNSEPAISKAGIYVQLQSWEHTYVYAFDETVEGVDSKTIKPFGNWPGKEITVATNGVDFHSQNGTALGGIGYIEVPYINLANTKIVVNNNAGSQSGNQPLVAGQFYWHDGSVGNADLGKSAALVMEVADIFKDGGSICSLTRSQAQTLLNKYNDEEFYEVTCQGSFDKTTFYTWADSSKTGQANFTGAQVVEQLTWLASTENPNILILNRLTQSSVGSEIIVIVITAITAATLAVGLVLILKKKKQN